LVVNIVISILYYTFAVQVLYSQRIKANVTQHSFLFIIISNCKQKEVLCNKLVWILCKYFNGDLCSTRILRN